MLVVIIGISALIVGVVIGVILQKAINRSKMLNYMQLTREMRKNSLSGPSKNFRDDIKLNELVEAFPELKDATTGELRPYRIAFKDLYGNTITPESAQIEDASNGAYLVFYDTSIVNYDKNGKRKTYF